eukprot:341753_1
MQMRVEMERLKKEIIRKYHHLFISHLDKRGGKSNVMGQRVVNQRKHWQSNVNDRSHVLFYVTGVDTNYKNSFYLKAMSVYLYMNYSENCMISELSSKLSIHILIGKFYLKKK